MKQAMFCDERGQLFPPKPFFVSRIKLETQGEGFIGNAIREERGGGIPSIASASAMTFMRRFIEFSSPLIFLIIHLYKVVVKKQHFP